MQSQHDLLTCRHTITWLVRDICESGQGLAEPHILIFNGDGVKMKVYVLINILVKITLT